MTENLQKAYDAYQQALVNLRDPKVSGHVPPLPQSQPLTCLP